MSQTDRLSDYTDASDETNHRAKMRIRNLLHARDYDDRLTQAELCRRVNNAMPEGHAVSKSTVRSLIRRVRDEYNIAIYSRGSGYYHIQSPDELADALGRIDEAIATKEQTKQELAAAFNTKTNR